MSAKRIIRLHGIGKDLKLSKVTMVRTNMQMINLDQLKDATWRLIYSEGTIPDITKLKSLEIIREG